MGYVGQHLTSVVTGFRGDRSGARGRDLILPNGKFAEIKTCYRVDQLGQCNNCRARVASIESACPVCNSTDIARNDDSKWLIGIRHEEEFAKILEPESYYFVLFEFADVESPHEIQASIWEVNPKFPGFAYCMVDYYRNIRTRSSSKAPFNLWPYSLKFCLMRPMLIYRSKISTVNDDIRTEAFPGRDVPVLCKLRPLPDYARSNNLTLSKIRQLSKSLKISGTVPKKTKRSALEFVQSRIDLEETSSEMVADKAAFALYFREIKAHLGKLPEPLKSRMESLLTAISR